MQREFARNPDCPTLTGWMLKEYNKGQNSIWSRNPYYWAVDSKGNQLPYIDQIIQTPNEGQGCRGGRTWEQPDDTMPRVYGITDENGRLMVVITYNTDLGDGWGSLGVHC